MNKTELKNFAIQSRRQLIDQVKTKALMYGIDEKNNLEIQEQFGQLMINDKPYPLYMKPAFNSLKNQLKQKGYKQLVEEVAYIWFNRIIAIRYMEVHDYLPEKVNVLSSSVGRVDPDILFEYETMDLPVKQEEIRELLHAGDTEGAFRKLFIAQCNALNSILPFLFEQIQDYTELLLPDFLLDAESVIKVLVQNGELTNSFEEIEVIGWLYQYYIAEEKDRVFAQKSKYKKEEIPFATQLFTPKWIVQYMVQNSLGRYWTEAHQEDEDLISNWEYFIKHEEQDFHEKIAPYMNKELRVEDIKLLDPAMGSGHILVYAFEVFHQIYEKCGYPERDIPRLIIENNLYGLDIDDRAYQLAAFAVVMKATSYSRRFLRSVEREGIQLNLASIQETNHISDSVIAYIAQEEKGERYDQVKAFFNQYHNAKTYGSLINISERDIEFINGRLEHIQNNPVEDLLLTEQHEVAKVVLPALVQQTEIMRNEYDVVVMNPPYMGNTNMNTDLSEFLKAYYPNSKSDLFATFMETIHYIKPFGMYSMINQQSWMFLSSYEDLRKGIIDSHFIDSMLHLGSGTFEEISGEVVQSTCFVNRNYFTGNSGIYIRLVEEKGSENKKISALNSINNMTSNKFIVRQEEFNKIIGSPISYWASENMKNLFINNKLLVEVAEPKQGLSTGDNKQFLRFWYEVDQTKIALQFPTEKSFKWYPFNKGGGFRKWYGNNEYVINWENNGRELKSFKGSVIRNPNYYFKEGITWSLITTNSLGARFTESGFIFDAGGSSLFSEQETYFLLGLLTSSTAHEILKILNPTLNISNGIIGKIPYLEVMDLIDIQTIKELVKENIAIARFDWDSIETSWDFKINPLISTKKDTLAQAYKVWMEMSVSQIEKMKSNEEKLNKIFSKLYKLEGEVSDYVENKDVTLLMNPHYKYKNLKNIETLDEEKLIQLYIKDTAKDFISYFIGCVLGRYSLERQQTVQSNGIIQFTDKPYFENDIITRLREFLSICCTPYTVDENMQWLAETLEMKKGEDAEARLRRYFLDEFFADHCKMYQKRPIYWLVDSGKQKGLRTLIYMHRYQPDTMATIRFEHLQEIQAKYQNEIIDLENRLVNPNLSASEKKKLTAEKTSFEKKMDELREFDKRLAEIANDEIEIDLDDGVKVNYEKFYRGGKGVLAKIK
ncbi:BREX-1 system adenine-specific DNA-methyltransferase PglX [Exiguobacterium aurantiacum]|uniref:BREX-1 system adenine-specific DNA-methyltransferase PglX n=1 Tax=Exiguobacterium aurantiacum TaxID=33987 RepID=UPI00384F92E0